MKRKSGKGYFRGQKGFTMIELLIVIAVLALLAGVVVPAVVKSITAARLAAANTEAVNVRTAALGFLNNNTCFPNDASDLMTAGTGGDGFDGPDNYLSRAPDGFYIFGNETSQNDNFNSNGDGYPDTTGTVNINTIFDATPSEDGITRNFTWDYSKQQWVR